MNGDQGANVLAIGPRKSARTAKAVFTGTLTAEDGRRFAAVFATMGDGDDRPVAIALTRRDAIRLHEALLESLDAIDAEPYIENARRDSRLDDHGRDVTDSRGEWAFTDWMPVASCPTEVIVETAFDAPGKGVVGRRRLIRKSGRVWYGENNSTPVDKPPTHWRPAAPEAGGEA